jgi:hypothetical protein
MFSDQMAHEIENVFQTKISESRIRMYRHRMGKDRKKFLFRFTI